MRTISILILSGLVVAACGRKEEPAPAPAPAPETETAAAEPAAVDEAELRQVCQAALAAIHGQDAAAVTIDGVDGPVARGSWAAPVDGGKLSAECQLDRGLIHWKPLGRPTPEENRWMTQPGDPVVRYSINETKITVTQTLADGQTVSNDYPLAAAAGEAR